MPAAITHYYHAQRVLELYKRDGIDRDAFLWGAQGPDFLFYHRALPWQKGKSLSGIGERLHQESPVRTLNALREYQNARHSNILQSYIEGFLCHYAADRTCHPFVQAQAQKWLELEPEQDGSIAHHEVESALDVILLRYEAAALPIEFNLRKTIPKNEAVQKEIAELYTFLLDELFHLSDAHTMVEQAIRDAHVVTGWLNDRTSLKKLLVERWEKKHGGKHTVSCHMRSVAEGDIFDYANTLLGEWRWPPESGEAKHESFFDVYERSVLDAQALMKGFFSGSGLMDLTENLPF